MADERGRRCAAGPLAAIIRTRDCAGGGLAASGVGAAFRLRAGGVGAPARSQCELGIAAAGTGGSSAGSDPTAGARGQNSGAGGVEVSGARSAPKPGGLPADGGDLRPASLRYAGSRQTIWRLAPRLARDPQAYSRCAGTVFQSAAAGGGESSSRERSRTVARSGNGGGDCEPRTAAADGRIYHGAG